MSTFTVVFVIVSFLLYHWAKREMRLALARLEQVQEQARVAMGCKCQQQKVNLEEPCKDQNDESFRQAYQRLNKGYIQAKAQIADLEKRLQTYQQTTKEYLESLNNRLHNTETYALAAVKSMEEPTRSEFLKIYGPPSYSVHIA